MNISNGNTKTSGFFEEWSDYLNRHVVVSEELVIAGDFNFKKNKNLVEDIEYLLSARFREILLSSLIGKVENMSLNQNQWWPSWISDQVKETLIGDIKYLLPVRFGEEDSEEMLKM